MASGGGGGQTLAEVYTVVVLMVNSGGHNSAALVYGSFKVVVTSSTGHVSTHILFEKERDQAVEVQENTNIPLQMTQVPAQQGSSFEFHADFWDAMEGPPDHKIVNYSVSFIPPISEDITAGGDVRVNVTKPE